MRFHFLHAMLYQIRETRHQASLLVRIPCAAALRKLKMKAYKCAIERFTTAVITQRAGAATSGNTTKCKGPVFGPRAATTDNL